MLSLENQLGATTGRVDNEGRHEVDFTTTLTEGFPIDTKLDSTAYEKTRAEGIARAWVAAAEGRSYGRTVQESEPLVNPGDTQPAVNAGQNPQIIAAEKTG